MAVLGPSASVNMSGHLQNQLTKSLEKILEDAYLSGELKLSGRKLKDFPKNVQFNLSDTVIADLSKNRLCEVPGEVAGFTYLERLLLACNAIRHVPDALGGLSSLTYLDLSSNQLSELPREICRLPHLQVLLVCDNRLTSLPKELGSMRALAELDAARNRLQQLPMAVGDMAALKALHLQSNQLGLLPLQITYLRLEYLDISCNCISSLPQELRQMSSLVTLKLDNNPLVSPPTTVCMRGRVHIFKYLENLAYKDSTLAGHTRRNDDTRRSAKLHGGATVVITSGHNTIDCLRHRTRHADSGYSTSDGGDKRWSNDGLPDDGSAGGGVGSGGSHGALGGSSGRSTPSTPSTLSPGPAGTSRTHTHSLNSEGRPHTHTPNTTTPLRVSPDGPNISNGDDKGKLGQQTYRQYKEALRQQRQQDVYRPRSDQSSPSDCDSSNQSPVHTPTLSPQHTISTPQSPMSNGHYTPTLAQALYNRSLPNSGDTSPSGVPSSPLLHSTPRRNITPSGVPQTTLTYQNGSLNSTSDTSIATPSPAQLQTNVKTDETAPKRPVQKVVPSRNTITKSTVMNGNGADYTRIPTTKYTGIPQAENTYIKPLSPTKSPTGTLLHNSVPPNVRSNIPSRRDATLVNGNGTSEGVNGAKLLTTTVTYLKGTSAKPAGGAAGSGRLTWHKDVAPEKLSFTMKREFDKQKEETELLQELKVIIESRLKMSLPLDLSPVLADGVVLCHLANHVRPRSVASVHVPSPAQPKLTMARCRRNVDNFLEACRKIGVEEAEVCSADVILQPGPDWAQHVVRIVRALLRIPPTIHHTQHRHNRYERERFVSNFNSNYFDKTEEFHLTAQPDNNLHTNQLCTDLYEREPLAPDFNAQYYLDETEEYELVNKNHNGNEVTLDNGSEWSVSTEGLKYRFVERNAMYRTYETDINKINYVAPLVLNEYKHKLKEILEEDNLSTDVVDFAKVSFDLYDRDKMNLDIKENLNELQNAASLLAGDKHRQLVTSLCLGTFLLTVLLLYLFPL